MAKKTAKPTTPKPKPVPLVILEGQTLAEALKAAWHKAHGS